MSIKRRIEHLKQSARTGGIICLLRLPSEQAMREHQGRVKPAVIVWLSEEDVRL
jgi:hypothetical protein